MTENLGFRYGVIALCVAASFFFLWKLWPISLGIDIQGGTILTYEVEKLSSTAKAEDLNAVKKDELESTIDAISQRINREGVRDMTVRAAGRNQIMISVPGRSADQVEPINRRMTQVGQLLKLIEAYDGVQAPPELGGGEFATFNRTRFDTQRKNAIKANRESGAPLFSPPACFRWYPRRPERMDKEPESAYKERVAEYERNLREKPEEVDGSWMYFDPAFWSVPGSQNPDNDKLVGFTGEHIESVTRTTDNEGGLAVAFEIRPDRRPDFARYTARYKDKAMALVLNEEIWNTARIESVLSDNVQIHRGGAGFSEEEQKWLMTCLQSGSLKLKPRLVDQNEIGATLGTAAVSRGIFAFVIGSLLVVCFMLVYYRTSGLIANLALIVNVILVFGIMILLDASWTLPGIAGLVLTLGMAVDGNILINERIREEIAKGKTLVQAAKLGYDRAFLTIFDSNLTTFVTAAALAWKGTGPIKGFGNTLMVGIVTTVFTSVYVTRTILGHMLKKGTIKEFRFREMRLPQYDFIKHAKRWTTISAVIIGLTWIVVITSGDSKYGLDFNGGTSVRVHFAERLDPQDVKQTISGIKDENGKQKYEQVEVVAFQPVNGKSEVVEVSMSETKDAKAAAKAGGDEFGSVKTEFDKAFQGKLIKRGLSEESYDPAFGAWSATLNLTTASDEAKLRKSLESSGIQKLTLAKADADGMSWKVGGTLVNSSVEKVRVIVADALATNRDLHLSNPFPRLRSLGPSVVANLKGAAIESMFLSLVFMLLYVWLRFKELKYGIAATIALVHDVMMALGISVVATKLKLVDASITLNAVAAYLTIVGYSINDTIVQFDRIRENLASSSAKFEDICNLSINQTLARSIFTSVTVFFTTLCIYVCNVGIDSPLEGLGFTLTMGVISGAYSTIFIATPIVIWLTNWEKKRAAAKSGVRAPGAVGSAS